MKIRIDTTAYEFSHGKQPRGEGSWGFCRVDPARRDYLDFVIWKHGRYAEAKRAAMQEAKGLADILYVCP